MQRSERHAGIRAFQKASLFRPGGSRVVRSILLQPNRILRIAAVVIALLYFFFFGPGLVRFFQDRLEVPGFVFALVTLFFVSHGHGGSGQNTS